MMYVPSTPVKVYFMDLKDSLSVLSDVLTGFRAVHVGLQYGDHYLAIPDGEKSSWREMSSAYRVIAPYIRYEVSIDPPDHDPGIVALSGEGWTVDSKARLFATEWLHYGADWGFWNHRPSRTSCVGTIAMLLNTMGVHVTATTSQKLLLQLKDMERGGLHGIHCTTKYPA